MQSVENVLSKCWLNSKSLALQYYLCVLLCKVEYSYPVARIITEINMIWIAFLAPDLSDMTLLYCITTIHFITIIASAASVI